MSDRIKLGWFNAWVGLVWIYLLIPSSLYLFNKEAYLSYSFDSLNVNSISTKVKADSSLMFINTEKGNFYYYDKNNYNRIERAIIGTKNVTIWYDSEDNGLADIVIDKRVVLGRSNLGILIFLIGFILSLTAVGSSVYLLIKTKGWGSNDLMIKHNSTC